MGINGPQARQLRLGFHSVGSLAICQRRVLISLRSSPSKHRTGKQTQSRPLARNRFRPDPQPVGDRLLLILQERLQPVEHFVPSGAPLFGGIRIIKQSDLIANDEFTAVGGLDEFDGD